MRRLARHERGEEEEVEASLQEGRGASISLLVVALPDSFSFPQRQEPLPNFLLFAIP